MKFDPALIRKYDRSGPRYTSYPTANHFTNLFKTEDYLENVSSSNSLVVPRPLSLYFHIPFCDTLCFYCGCNKVVTKDRNKGVQYLDYLYREIELQGKLFDEDRQVVQLHLGGGTPTFLSDEQLEKLLIHIDKHFNLCRSDKREFSIEIDPRGVDVKRLKHLADIGFNRISLGVQDFNPDVQKAVHRVQSPENTLALLAAARELGFQSTNVDLIYGLPLQTVETFRETLDRLMAASPDRLSIFNYAHLPQLFMPQKRIREEDLPSSAEKLAILKTTIEVLDQYGYEYIGMDHFAKPDDELAVARIEGTLHRNFQGYSTCADCDLIGMGVSSISQIDQCYSQNHKTLDEYYASLERNELPIARGIVLSVDDLVRRRIIEQILCYYTVDLDNVLKDFGARNNNVFNIEWRELRDMEADGLVELIDGNVIKVTQAGRFLLRNICMVFDHYLTNGEPQAFSKVI